ncbi:MAG: hypothetical protein LBS05_05225 [Tannerellaceae bacterium]|jgi:hypothetical protein|nr:hypothetical protein [Tannerellaceae bacterium]
MKKYGFFCVFFLLILSLVTSCLGDSGQKIFMGNYPGVVVKRNDSVKIHLKGGDVVYSSLISADVDDGDGVLIDFSLDYSLPINADSGKVKGFLTVDVSSLTPVPGHDLLAFRTDTSAVLPHEHTLASIQQRNAFILNRFFLFTEHRSDTLPLHFELSYDPDQVITDKVYDLFLRVAKEVESPSALQLKTQYNTFNISDLSHRETDSLLFRIHYVTGFNKDSTQISWVATPIYRFAL